MRQDTVGYTIQFENSGKRGMIGTWQPTIMEALNEVRTMAKEHEIITLTKTPYKDRMSVPRAVKNV